LIFFLVGSAEINLFLNNFLTEFSGIRIYRKACISQNSINNFHIVKHILIYSNIARQEFIYHFHNHRFYVVNIIVSNFLGYAGMLRAFIKGHSMEIIQNSNENYERGSISKYFMLFSKMRFSRFSQIFHFHSIVK
jgi:hypothetical protein